MKKIKKICFHIGSSIPHNYWIELAKQFNSHGINVCYIVDGSELNAFLYENKIESYSIDVKGKDKTKDEILGFLRSISNYDINEIIYTQYVFNGKRDLIILQEKALQLVSNVIDFIPNLVNIDVFLDFAGNEIGHVVFDCISRAKKTRIIKFRESLFPDRIVLTENQFSFWEVLNTNKPRTIDVKNKVNDFIETYFEKKTVFWGNPKDRDFKIKITGKGKLQKVFSIKKWKSLFYSMKRLSTKYVVRRLYDSDIKIDTTKKVFYFPLHYPLDSQLVYRGRPFLDQVSFALTIADFLPYNSQLIIKEHPHARGAISFNNLKRLREDSRIVLLHPWVNSHDILEKTDYVITINSTVALEALYKNIPVISFGKNYLQGHGLVYEIEKFYDLFKLYNIESFKNQPNEKMFLEFLENAYLSSYPFNIKSIFNLEVNKIEEFVNAIIKYILKDE